MEELVRASRVKAKLALNPDTSNLELEVLCKNGTVQVKGKIYETAQIQQIHRIARGVEGVTAVDVDQLASPIPA
jgi:osmotically-inducible protein OsmY